MNRIRRRRQSFGSAKPKPTAAVVALICSGVSLAILAGLIVYSASVAGDTTNLAGALAFLAQLMALGSTIIIAGQLKVKEDMGFKILCLFVSLVALMVWVSIYVMGMLN